MAGTELSMGDGPDGSYHLRWVRWLDVHKASVSVALAEGGRGGEARELGVFENRPEILAKLVTRLSKGGRRLSFCYQAGPCGRSPPKP
jgi:hypothetical protein